MDPITLGLLMAVGAGGATAWLRARAKARAKDAPKPDPSAKKPAAPEVRPAGGYRVGDVILHLGEEFWLAGELSLQREGSAALRLFLVPEKGGDRWLALPRQGDVVYLLKPDRALADLGWPGVEVPLDGRVLRPVEHGPCAVVPSGEVDAGWEGVGRYVLLRAMESVALVVEQGRNRLALRGKEIPRALLERLG